MNGVAGGSYRRIRTKVAIGVVGISIAMGVVDKNAKKMETTKW